MSRNIFKLINITKYYGENVALKDVTLEFPDTGFVFIEGVSGSGKTTLMNLLSGLDSASSGEIFYENRNILQFKNKELDNYRNSEIGIVFQSFNLIEDMTVEENLYMSLIIQKMSDEERKIRVKEVLSYIGLDQFAKRKSNELSAGQKQRVAIARAIIKKPKVVFADEATGNLDYENTELILKLFNKISQKCLVVLISHDSFSAKKFGDRIITLSNGAVCKDINNKDLKKLYLEPYKIKISGNNYIKEMYLDEFDIKNEIKNIIGQIGKNLDTYLINAEITLEKKNKENEIEYLESENSSNVQKMPFLQIIRSVFRMIKRKKIKTVLVICLMAFISTMFFIANVIVNNDYNMSLSRYIQGSECKLFNVKKSVFLDCDNEYYDVYKGENFFTNLKEMCGNKNVVKGLESKEFFVNNNVYLTNTYLYDSDFFNDIKLVGKWPNKNKEIVISNEFARDASIKIGDYISDDEVNYKVVGMCDFSEVNKDYNVVLSENYNSDVFYKNNCINLQAANILVSMDISEYVSSLETIGSIKNITKKNLVWGRLPQEKNEVVISKNALEENGENLEEHFITKYRIPDLSAEKYGSKYDCYINLNKYLGKKIKIVGVYDENCSEDEYGNILIYESLYDAIINDYNNYLNYDLCCVKIKNGDYKLIQKLTQSSYYLCNGVCSYIYMIKDFSEKIDDIMNMLVIVMLVMVLFIIISFLSYNVKDFSKTIGIYKSLGVENLDIFKMFLIDNMLVAISSIIVANFSVRIITYYINQKIISMIDESGFKTFIINDLNCFLMSMVILIFSVLATIVPLNKLVNRESIVLLNREEN